MKCVKNSKEIRRVTEEEAMAMVKTGWAYCPKKEWKTKVRGEVVAKNPEDIDPENPEDIEIVEEKGFRKKASKDSRDSRDSKDYKKSKYREKRENRESREPKRPKKSSLDEILDSV